jgi:hypothetical protein
MRRTRSTAVNILLRMLDPVDRDVVDGDLRELRLPRNRAIRELLGCWRSDAHMGPDVSPGAFDRTADHPCRPGNRGRSHVGLVVLVR